MKHQAKMTVTLSMIWIGSMALIQDPAWIRAALDFVGKSTGHVPVVGSLTAPPVTKRGPQ